MMSRDVIDEIRGLALGESQYLINAWEEHFKELGIAPADQLEDFKATIRMRVQSHCISLLPDDVNRVLG